MPDVDLAQRIREYARNRGGPLFADKPPMVSSAWLAREFGVDPRTIAAALRPYGVAPGEVERGVRGYSTAELAGIVLPGDDPDPVNHWSEGMTDAEVAVAVAAGNVEVPLSELAEVTPDPVDVGPVESGVIGVLSAAAGHDMTPALRAAGLL